MNGNVKKADATVWLNEALNKPATPKAKPVKKFSTGAIQATVWLNEASNKEGEIVEFNTISFQRRYLDKETNEWKNTSSLRVGDLPKAELVLRKAYEFLVLKEENAEV